jgi:hypothetical protein
MVNFNDWGEWPGRLNRELNPRRRVYIEIEGGAKMNSKLEALAEGFDVILATHDRVLVSQHKPRRRGLNFNSKMPQSRVTNTLLHSERGKCIFPFK